jgi:hypothetical protein
MDDIDFNKMFEYENNFYLTATVGRISKFATHLEFYKRITGLPGEIVECGVFKGNSLSRLIKFRSLFENCFSRRVIAFDVFGEFPETEFQPDIKRREEFIQEAGSKSITREQMITTLKKNNLSENIELVKGNILVTVPEYLQKNPQLKISLLHIDVDLYEPTKTVLEFFFPCVVNGGIVVLDDYSAFAGANKAIDDYFSDKNVIVQKLSYSNAISYVEKKY